METELFRVVIKNGELEIDVDKNVIEEFGMTLEEFDSKFNQKNLLKGIEDFIDTLRE